MIEDLKRAQGRCPICGGKAQTACRPFCSARCRDVDLARWLGDGYAIAGGPAEGGEDGEDGGRQPGGAGGRRNDGEDDPA